ncbi:hypothetical protein MTO96_033228, partial [Rhipicephalus appendiculatus]
AAIGSSPGFPFVVRSFGELGKTVCEVERRVGQVIVELGFAKKRDQSG